MTDVNDLESMERFIDKKIEPLNKQISMLQIELEGVKKQLSIPLVSNQRELLIDFRNRHSINAITNDEIDRLLSWQLIVANAKCKKRFNDF